MPGRILIVDDHEVVRQGIRTILKARPQWELVGEAVNGKDAIEKAQKLNPDVILMDITMPEMSGIEATREITKLKLRAGILIFTMHESKNLAETVREAGARGLVLKSHAARDLLEALETLMGGGTFFGGQDARKGAEEGKERKDRGLIFCAGLRLANAFSLPM
jgi:DNA-binding NarL/FixJ family response regulator